MPAHRPRRERIAARIATGPVGHLACGIADWAELMSRHLLARAIARFSRGA